MNPVLRDLGGNPLAAIQDLKIALAADGAPLFDFSVGDPIEPTPEPIRRALLEGVDAVSQYPTAAGLPELREAVAGWVRRRFGVEVDPDREVLPTSGSKEGIFHLPFGIIDPAGPKRATLWGSPGYPIYERGTRFAGGESDPVVLTPSQDWQLRLDELDPARLDRAAIAWLNYPHNPTGAMLGLDGYRRALEVARAHGVVLASDECYADVYPGQHRPASLLESAEGDLSGVVVAFSCSKRSGMTGYRSGALVGDAGLLSDQRTLRRDTGTASPAFVQRAAAAAWSDDAHAAQRREAFEAKRAVLLDFLGQAGLEVSGSEATFYLWVAAPGGDDAAYAEALLRHRVVATPGRAFGAAGAGWLRLALVPDVEGCRAAVARWQEAIDAGSLPGA
ncbi:MAG: aminotransferase class I/II-fold pyridoxal phosphate-dependent enzyme [Actinomycetota bacterium]